MSAQYILTRLVESCNTWYNGCPLRGRSGHMVKSQGLTAGVWTNVVRSIPLDPFAGKLPDLILWLSVENKQKTYWFSGDVIKGQGQTADLHPKCCLLSISWSFPWWLLNLLHWLTLGRRLTPLPFGSQGLGQTTGLRLGIVHAIFYILSKFWISQTKM